MWAAPRLEPDRVVFLSGAGISADAPTNAPIGNQLTERAFEVGFLPGTMQKILGMHALLGFPDRVVRLEAVLDIVMEAHGEAVLDDLVSDLHGGRPNELHRFFGQHLALGGRHITANFDNYIETACGVDRVLHFHGSLDGPGGIHRLGLRLSGIEKGFDKITRGQLKAVLTARGHSILVVVGYSGSDYFDIDPFFAAEATSLIGSIDEVVWIEHDRTASQPESIDLDDPRYRQRRLSKPLDTNGMPTRVVRGRTVDALNQFGARWGLPPIAERGRKAAPWSSSVPVDDMAKARASALLYRHAGMYLDFQNTVDGAGAALADLQDDDTQAGCAWQRGDRKAAAEHWSTYYANDPARRLERLAACRWVRGAHFRAYATALSAVGQAQRDGDDEALGQALETTTRILISMRRSPDTRWFASRRRAAALEKRIANLIEENRFGVHLLARLNDVLAYLRGEEDFTAGSETFFEFESLTGALDYLRGEKRKAVSAGRDVMTREWLDFYETAATALGKLGDANSLVTMPGAAAIYRPREALRRIRAMSATPWHRLRLIVQYFASRHLRTHDPRDGRP